MEQQPLPEDIPVYEIVDSSEETEVDDQIEKYPKFCFVDHLVMPVRLYFMVKGYSKTYIVDQAGSTQNPVVIDQSIDNSASIKETLRYNWTLIH